MVLFLRNRFISSLNAIILTKEVLEELPESGKENHVMKTSQNESFQSVIQIFRCL